MRLRSIRWLGDIVKISQHVPLAFGDREVRHRCQHTGLSSELALLWRLCAHPLDPCTTGLTTRLKAMGAPALNTDDSGGNPTIITIDFPTLLTRAGLLLQALGKAQPGT